MLNREEILYNVASLVSTWLSGSEDVSDLRVKFIGENSERIMPCLTKVECVNRITDALCNNVGHYTKVILYGVLGGREKEFGTLDIN